MSSEIAVGIDLGTSYSCVAIASEGPPQVIPNEWGERTHASVVSFLEDGHVLVGNDAKKNIITNAENTVYSAKRLIGRFYFSDEVKKAQAVMPYRIVEGPNNAVRVQVGGAEPRAGGEGERSADEPEQRCREVPPLHPGKGEAQEGGELHPERDDPGRADPRRQAARVEPDHPQPRLDAVGDGADARGAEDERQLLPRAPRQGDVRGYQ
jgi:hypothetical protein